MMTYDINPDKYLSDDNIFVKYSTNKKDFSEEVKEDFDQKIQFWQYIKSRQGDPQINLPAFDNSSTTGGWEFSDIFGTSSTDSSTRSGSSSTTSTFSQTTLPSSNSSFTEKFLSSAKEWIGTPYKWAGRTKGVGVDCSNFVSAAAEKAGLKLSGSVSDQWNRFSKDNRIFYDASQLQPGDLIFFKNTVPGKDLSHVAIYMGDGKIIHASSSKGVTIANLGDNYYQKHLKGYGRMYNS